MSVEYGAIAAKLGNIYERQYAVEQLLHLIRGRIAQLRWEPASGDLDGADVELVLTDGGKEHVQLKRQNKADAKWTPAVLNQRGVLSAAAHIVDNSPPNRFTFISSDPVPYLKDICDQLTRREVSELEFIRNQVDKPAKRRACFDQLLSYWGLTKGNDLDEIKAIRWLSSMSFRVLDRGDGEAQRLDMLAQLCLTGDPSTIIATLAAYLEMNLKKPVTADMLLKHLDNKGFQPRDLARDPSLPTALHDLQSTFISSMKSRLTAYMQISRPLAHEIASAAADANGPRIVFIHGKQGIGKSGVLLQVVEELIEQNVTVLPLSLSTHPPIGSVLQYGENLQLKATPAAAIRAIAADKHAVLLIDQLDALRFTTSSSAAVWAICTKLLEQAISDVNTTVVVACRTFDFDNDPNIRQWKEIIKRNNANAIRSFQVSNYEELEIQPILQDVDINYQSLPARLQQLLLHPATLDVWHKLVKRDVDRRDFATQTQLLDELFRTLRAEARRDYSVSDPEISSALEIARTRIAETGRSTVPASVFDAFQAALNACCGVGIFTRSGSVIEFPHQCYYDFLVARSAHTASGGDPSGIVSWIKSDQLLERRDQIRQLLFLLGDENPEIAANTYRLLISDSGIRFHVKQIVLGVLREATPVTPMCIALIEEMLDDVEWNEHAHKLVLWQSAGWFKALHAQEFWSKRLADSSENEQLLWLRTILRLMPTCPSEVDDVLAPLLVTENGIKQIGIALGWSDPSEDSPAIAQLRDAQIRLGKWTSESVFLDRLADRDPIRVVSFVDCMVRGMLRKILHAAESDSDDHIEILSEVAVDKKIAKAISDHPQSSLVILTRLIRLCERVEMLDRSQGNRDNGFVKSYRLRTDQRDLLDGVCTFATHAISELAKKDSNSLKAYLDSCGKYASLAIESCIAEGLARSAAGTADIAIRWLTNNQSCFRMKVDIDQDPRQLAENIIRQFAPSCSGETLIELESVLLSCYPKEEKDQYRYLLEHEFPNGYWGMNVAGVYKPIVNPLGRTQHLLLGAIPESRRSDRVVERLHSWDAKFGGPAIIETHNDSVGGTVRSPIPQDRIELVSDTQWVKIATTDYGPKPRKWKQIGPDEISESSPRHFSSDFGTLAKKQPSRCLKIALKFPENVPNIFVTGLWGALADKDTDLISCSVTDLDLILQRTLAIDDRMTLINACRAIEHHPHVDWPDSAWQLIEKAASHEDPKDTEYSVPSRLGEDTGPDVESTSMNCVRGSAASTLAALAWNDKKRSARVLPIAIVLASDNHPAVRIAAAHTAMGVYTVDRDAGIALLQSVVTHKDDRVLAGHHLNNMIQYVRWHSRGEKLSIQHARGWHRIKRFWALRKWRASSPFPSLFSRMSCSTYSNTAKRGAHWITAERFQFGSSKRDFKRCWRGSVDLRQAIAKTLCNLVSDKDSRSHRVVQSLTALFDDPDLKVRTAAASIFRQDHVLEGDVGVRLARAHIRSKAFADAPDSLIWPLSHEAVNLTKYQDVILEIADKLAGPLADEARNVNNRTGASGRKFSLLLLQLYNAATKDADQKLANRCLDQWDALLQNRVGHAETHLESLLP